MTVRPLILVAGRWKGRGEAVRSGGELCYLCASGSMEW